MNVKNDSIIVISSEEMEQPSSPTCNSKDETRLATLSSISSSPRCNSRDETRLFTVNSSPKRENNEESLQSPSFPVTSTPVTNRGTSVTAFFSDVNNGVNKRQSDIVGKGFRCCFGTYRAKSKQEVAAHQFKNHLDRFGTQMVLTKCCPVSQCHFKTNKSEEMEVHLQFGRHQVLAASNVNKLMARDVYKCQFATIHLYSVGGQFVAGCTYQAHIVSDLINHYIMDHTEDLNIDKFMTPEFKTCSGN
jgi:hypothetical protein